MYTSAADHDIVDLKNINIIAIETLKTIAIALVSIIKNTIAIIL